MRRTTGWTVAVLLVVTTGATAADGPYTIKAAKGAAPKELREPIRKLLADESVQLVAGDGKPICEVWFRRELPAKAGAEPAKTGLTYRDLEETTVFGAVRYDRQATDYRKQKIKPGVYTLRLGFQPMDGDHMGTAPYNEFLLLVPARLDEKPAPVDPKELQEMSAKAIGGSHPGVLLLFPNEKPEDTPKLVDKGNNTWVLNVKEVVASEGKPGSAPLGVGLTLVGQTTAE
jgi:hypothetical protein